MTRQFCDLCAAEVTGIKSGAIHGIADADNEGNGTCTDNFDHVCTKCYRAWKAFVANCKRGRR